MEIAGRTLVVTGGGNGIGQQVVFELLRRGANVAAVDLRAESLEQTVAEAGVGDRLRTYTVDVTDRAAVEALPAQVVADFGAVDGLLNVAGIIQPFVRLVDLEYDAIERVLAVNLWGTIHTVKAFLPLLLERPVAHVVNVSSMGGFLPVPGQTIYGASKAAVKLLSEGLFAELLDTNVGVSVVMPGAVGTDITGNSGVAVPGGADAAAAEEGGGFPTTPPQDAASTIVDGIVDDRLHVYVGRDARLMNIAVRTAPKQAARLITRQMAALLDG